MKLTPGDIKILAVLQHEGQLTNQTLAEKVGMSSSACWRRVRQLEEEGVIQGYRAAFDRRKVGLGVLAFIRVKIDGHSEKEARQFETEVLSLEQVVACYSIAGDADFLLHLAMPDLDSYADFATTVARKLPRIKEMNTTFVLKEIKQFIGWPLTNALDANTDS
ncbi:Lrp/AsnC family transcriptional regulator [Cupriavidus basilensis]